MDFHAFNLMYLGQYLSVEVTKRLAVFGMVLKNPIFNLYQRALVAAAEKDRYYYKHSESDEVIDAL